MPNQTDQTQFKPTRRAFIGSCAGLTIAQGYLPIGANGASQEHPSWYCEQWDPQQKFLMWGKPIRVQPILMYTVAQPGKMRSWRSWGDVLDDASAEREAKRINEDLHQMRANAEFPIEALPTIKVKTPEQAQHALSTECDVVLLCPASGSGSLLQACTPPDCDTLIFVRHRSGATYYWYEALSVKYLKTGYDSESSQETRLGHVHVDDVVVDDFGEVLWRMRSLYGIKNLKASRIVALGGVWGKYASDAPEIAKKQFGLEIIEIGYPEIEKRIKKALDDRALMSRAEQNATTYLNLPGTELKTGKPFVVRAFMLYELFKQLMHEHNAPAFTIKDCMSTIIPMSRTTACLTLGLMNDEGIIAFCESDFVIIPAGLLLRHIANTPVFLHNSTFPHNAIATCAHCSAPRRMNGDRYEPVEILTHEESDYGAAPKVEIPIGQQVSFINPEYTSGRWVGFRGHVIDNPFLPICRSQQDVRIQGQWEKLKNEVRDSHWMMAYGDCLKEIGYAARKLGLRWDNITDIS